MSTRTDRWHRNLMADYYAMREAWQINREAVTAGYTTEQSTYDSQVVPLTFKIYLTGGKR